MLAVEIFAAILLGMVAIYFKARKTTAPIPAQLFQPETKTTDNYLSEPIISYSVFVADIKTQRLIEVKPPADYPHHYGILNGQHFELHWNVINADFISIDGIGYVQAVGKKSLFPLQHKNYKISARNRNYSAEQEFVVHVFPVPLMETVFFPIPDLSFSKIEINITPVQPTSKPDAYVFPSLKIPSVTDLQKNIVAEKPSAISLKTGLIKIQSRTEYRSFKTRLFNLMEKQFEKNYKMTDIIQTIRKHYE